MRMQQRLHQGGQCRRTLRQSCQLGLLMTASGMMCGHLRVGAFLQRQTPAAVRRSRWAGMKHGLASLPMRCVMRTCSACLLCKSGSLILA